MVPPEVVALVGVVQPETPCGYPPPMARSRMMDMLWSDADWHPEQDRSPLPMRSGSLHGPPGPVSYCELAEGPLPAVR